MVLLLLLITFADNCITLTAASVLEDQLVVTVSVTHYQKIYEFKSPGTSFVGNFIQLLFFSTVPKFPLFQLILRRMVYVFVLPDNQKVYTQ